MIVGFDFYESKFFQFAKTRPQGLLANACGVGQLVKTRLDLPATYKHVPLLVFFIGTIQQVHKERQHFGLVKPIPVKKTSVKSKPFLHNSKQIPNFLVPLLAQVVQEQYSLGS